jgi:hypothetical protein
MKIFSINYIDFLLVQNYDISCVRMARVALCVFFALILLIPSVSNSVFAVHKSEGLVWQLIMLSSDACSNYHYQMTQKYNEITNYYLDLYELNHKNHPPQCYNQWDYQKKYNLPHDVDLLILVYDRNMGRQDLHSYDLGGFYSHLGNEWTHNHAIIFCDCPNFRFSEPSWILTHELSHFVLYYLGYDKAIVEDLVHDIDHKSDYCVEVSYDLTCVQYRMRLNTDNYEATVMPPYKEAIGKDISAIVQTIDNEDPARANFVKKIAEWWKDGVLSDENYLDGLNLLVESINVINEYDDSIIFSAESPNVVFTDPPTEKKKDIQAHEESIDFSSKKFNQILKIHPFSEAFFESEQDDTKNQIPQWFTTRTEWWLNGTMTDTEFFKGLEYYSEKEWGSGERRVDSSELFNNTLTKSDTVSQANEQVVAEETGELWSNDEDTGDEIDEEYDVSEEEYVDESGEEDNDYEGWTVWGLDVEYEDEYVYEDEVEDELDDESQSEE